MVLFWLVVSLVLTASYLVGAGATWERLRPGPPPDALDYHKRICGFEYPSLYHCPKHNPGRKECAGCWEESLKRCGKYGTCREKRQRDAHTAFGDAVAQSIFWLFMLPVWLGRRLMRGPAPAQPVIDAEALAALERQVLETELGSTP